MSKRLSVIIPCHNEEQAIPSVIEELSKFDNLEIIVIDDASTDRSYELLQKYPYIKILRNFVRQGYGASLKKGFAEAKSEYLAFIDMDKTYPIQDLNTMLQICQTHNVDMVCGQRPMRAKGMSFTRGAGNWLYTFMVRCLFGSKMRDVCTGFRVLHSRRKAEVISLTESGLNFSLMLSLWSVKNKWQHMDHQIDYHPRVGDSKLHVSVDGFRFSWVIFREYIQGFTK